MKTVLQLKNVCKVFGEHPETALQMLDEGENKDSIFEKTGQTLGVVNATFDVHEGEVFVVMGLSGSGKSTLVRLLNRLIEPSRGEILLNGEDIARANDPQLREIRRKTMSMVFQSFALMPHLTVLDNTAFGLELSGVDVDSRRQRALDSLRQVGLDAWADSYPDELSGGMQQRVGLARALANDPQVLLMDEAFSALDPLIRTEMQDELLKLQAEDSRTIIFISHDLDEAMRIGDRIAIMEGGRVVQVGTPEEILNNPADAYVSSFFRGVDIATVYTASDIARKEQVTVIRQHEDDRLRSVLQRLQQYDHEYGYVIDQKEHFRGVVSVESLQAQLEKDDPTLAAAYLQDVPTLAAETPLNEILGEVATAPCGLAVVDGEQRYLGVVTRAGLLEMLDREN
jgi:glycine betaine/proline transport system ATP-binding protein